MSVIFFASRKSAITQKKKVVIRKVGTLSEGKSPSITASWKLHVNNKKCTISFSRDSMNVFVDGAPVECTAYITDSGYDLDLLFNLGDKKGHIYSDVEGTEMTNYLFFDGECIASDKMTNLSSKHCPE